MKSQTTECTSYDTSVWFPKFKGKHSFAAAMEEFVIHGQNKEFSLQSLLNSHTFTFLSLWSKE
jgi:hypothetical protein